jgi:hypothetical protein
MGRACDTHGGRAEWKGHLNVGEKLTVDTAEKRLGHYKQLVRSR